MREMKTGTDTARFVQQTEQKKISKSLSAAAVSGQSMKALASEICVAPWVSCRVRKCCPGLSLNFFLDIRKCCHDDYLRAAASTTVAQTMR